MSGLSPASPPSQPAADGGSEAIRAEQRVWSHPGSLRFFQAHRNDPRDLYLSERLFLPAVLPLVDSCLDVGCAAGGFSRIMKTFNPRLAYTGVDINEEFVEIARRAYPDSRFEVGDGIRFATPPDSFELVFVGGMLHLNSRYREIVRACYAQSSRVLLCDFRVTRGPGVIGSSRLDFEGDGGVGGDLPYIVVNLDELIELFRVLTPAPGTLTIRGYRHPVSPTARGVPPEVIMAYVLADKRSEGGPTAVTVDIRERAEWERTLAEIGRSR